MSEEKKTRKKKLLFRYLILAACILVVAAITVTVVFAANDWFRSDITIDDVLDKPKPSNPGNTDNPGNTEDPGHTEDPGKPNEPDKPTGNETTFALPVSNPNVINVFDFGKDVSLGHWHFHTGLDMAATAGTAVVACLDGTVSDIVVDDKLDGTTVTIQHANGLKTVYSYIDLKEGLKKGDNIKRGDQIGTVSEPEGAEFKQEAHLHFEVIENGEKKDPAKFLDIAEK
ncbi:MAG: M23 family metallopeptidase [Clostridia bacterium]|nr:M23 family metallopeptidase [Clostridia bacterium]